MYIASSTLIDSYTRCSTTVDLVMPTTTKQQFATDPLNLANKHTLKFYNFDNQKLP